MNLYKKNLDHIHFSPDFEEKTISRILQQQPYISTKPTKRAKVLAASITAFILLTASVFAGRNLLSGSQIAAFLGNEKLENALLSENFAPQSVMSGDYRITLQGFITDNHHRSFALLSVARIDGNEITIDSEIYRNFTSSFYIQDISPIDFNIFTQSGNSSYFIEDGVYYCLISMNGIHSYLGSGKNIYIAAYEGLAPPIIMEADGSIRFSENFNGVGAIFTIKS